MQSTGSSLLTLLKQKSSRKPRTNWISPALAAFTFLLSAHGQTMKAPDITKTPTLYVVPYAHLDTQWRWEFPQSISEYLLKTMRVNFDYFDKYPHYVFNWTGANRYRLMKEYFPADYARMQQYAAAGRWFPAGSSIEEATSISQALKQSFARFSTATYISVKTSARPATNTCCPTVSVFPRHCPVSWRTPA
jgi:alpha-mannosidase